MSASKQVIRIIAAVLAVVVSAVSAPAGAQGGPPLDLAKLFSSVVAIRAEVPENGRTAASLGARRAGNGVVIDDNGLVLTIGYLILEASNLDVLTSDGRAVPARTVAYDNDSGFGLVRAEQPLDVAPIALGDSDGVKRLDPVVVASVGGEDAAIGAFVLSRREFAGSWEYLLEDAIFTAPPHPAFGGAALIDTNGKLIGIGSLFVGDASGTGESLPGNMFVPINRLKTILADLLATGRSTSAPSPWLGVSTVEIRGKLVIERVQDGGPAQLAGLKRGDFILGVAGRPVAALAEFYRTIRALGPAGTVVPLTILSGAEPAEIEVKSVDRARWLAVARPSD